MRPLQESVFHVFLASPGDMNRERQEVRDFFTEFNRTEGGVRALRFEVVDWENYTTAGIGRPQDLVTRDTLDRFRQSLALVIVLIGQRFGTPTGSHESGTEEEIEWAVASHTSTGFPEVKLFFKKIPVFQAPGNLHEVQAAVAQWERVSAFNAKIRAGNSFLIAEFDDGHFEAALRRDLSVWLHQPQQPWNLAWGSATAPRQSAGQDEKPADLKEIPVEYLNQIVEEFQSLDIAGIDNERAVDIPLDEVYIQLRVARDDDRDVRPEEADLDDAVIGAEQAFNAHPRLVIVGDPGSGKSTFLRFIALTLARARTAGATEAARERFTIDVDLPIPVFVSLWDLSDFLSRSAHNGTDTIDDFLVSQFTERRAAFSSAALRALLESGRCCLLFDGLDEVPTDHGRALISRLVEGFVSQYSKNRFVVTSRKRAYTSDAILRAEFVRCDLQDLSAADRAHFLKNWFAALFAVAPTAVLDEGSRSALAYETLRDAIERKDRIRALAVNPLMMTVISIVHWNRKRLPDQRVNLYDECVDVLLGQRKSAERTRRLRHGETFKEETEDKESFDRAWIRKRFSEIALRILQGEGDEIARSTVVDLLKPRFIDRGARNDEEAVFHADAFLDRQELRSGLLVRRTHSCRFVHLTFQEYLAAWHIAAQSTDAIEATVGPHLRRPKWFETLQLLGGELARNSDEKFNGYIGWLLDHLGSSIGLQAPIIALISNILQDTQGVADIAAPTRQRYSAALRGTLDAFRRDSGVSAKNQLEVLDALERIGPGVKEHLIQATRSAFYQVRAKALQAVVRHLSDDELFSMTRLLQDRSQETISIFLTEVFKRDHDRAIALFRGKGAVSERLPKAVWLARRRRPDLISPNDLVEVLEALPTRVYMWNWAELAGAAIFLAEIQVRVRDLVVVRLRSAGYSWSATYLIRILEPVVRDATVRSLLLECLGKYKAGHAPSTAAFVLAIAADIDEVFEAISKLARESEDTNLRDNIALRLGRCVRTDRVENLLVHMSLQDQSDEVRRSAISSLGQAKYRERFLAVAPSALRDKEANVRHATLVAMAHASVFTSLRSVVVSISTEDPDASVRSMAVWLLGQWARLS